jgi:hypothetical protein
VDTDVTALSTASFAFRPLLKEHPEIADRIITHLTDLLRKERALTAELRRG